MASGQPISEFSATGTAANVVKWLCATEASIAIARAHDLYGDQPKDAQPIIYTDGIKGRSPLLVKPFGRIMFVPSTGPIAEAIDAAWSYVQGATGHQVSGFYADSFQWYVNGKPVAGKPDGKKLGPRSNVQLANLAPYAITREIQIPRGVIYGAALALRRTYGKRLQIGYAGRRPQGPFTPKDAPQYGRRAYPMNVPTLIIASPAGPVRAKMGKRRKAISPTRKARR
jgi:hypothetical protein